MPIMRFPGTVSRPAETIDKHMDLISAAHGVSEIPVEPSLAHHR